MPTGENKAEKLAPNEAEIAQKKERVNKEKKRLAACFKKLTKSYRAVVGGLIDEAANIRITLEDLREDCDENGWTELFSQSEKVEPYEKKRAKAELYISLTPNYQKAMDRLISYLPEEEKQKVKDDGFESFVSTRT